VDRVDGGERREKREKREKREERGEREREGERRDERRQRRRAKRGGAEARRDARKKGPWTRQSTAARTNEASGRKYERPRPPQKRSYFGWLEPVRNFVCGA
jgi:hypothetical protein